MSARELIHSRNGARAAAVLCRWERGPQGDLRATWRQDLRAAADADADGLGPAVSDGPAVGARQRPIRRWVSGGAIAALYLLVTFAGLAIVVRV